MKIDYIQTRSAHLPEILKLNNEAQPAVSEISLSELEYFFETAIFFPSAMVDNILAGFLIVLGTRADYDSMNYQWFMKRYDSFTYIDRIVVAPKFQGHGIGNKLYQDLIQFSRGKVPRITCEVNLKPRNEGSLRFHRRLGFKEVGIQDTEGGKKTVSLMEKRL